jgi:transposase-like protein
VPGQPKYRAFCKLMETRGDEFFERVAGGETVKSLLPEFGISRQQMMRWVHDHKHPKRLESYQEARRIASSAWVDDAREIVDSADASSSASILKAKLQSDFRRWHAGVTNRQEYGTQQDVGVQVNIGSLHLDALKARGGPPALPKPLLSLPSEIVEAEVVE